MTTDAHFDARSIRPTTHALMSHFPVESRNIKNSNNNKSSKTNRTTYIIVMINEKNAKAKNCCNQNTMKIILASMISISLSFMLGTMSGLNRRNDSIEIQRAKCSNTNSMMEKILNNKKLNDKVEQRVKEGMFINSILYVI